MGRWTYEDEDSYRLPEGFTRIAYDADSQVYTYRDRQGRLYKGASGASYGLLRPLAAPPKSTQNERVQMAPVDRENRRAAATDVDAQEAGRAVSSTPTPKSVTTTSSPSGVSAATTSRQATMPARSNRVTRSTSDGAPTPKPPTSTTHKVHDTTSPTTNSPSGGPATTTSRRATISASDNRVTRSSSGGAPESSLPKLPAPELPAPKPPATTAHKTLDAPQKTTSSPSGGSPTAMSRQATMPARRNRIPDSILNKPTPKLPTTTDETPMPASRNRIPDSILNKPTPKLPTTTDETGHTTSHTPPTTSSPSGESPPTTTSRRATILERSNRMASSNPDGPPTLESSLPKSGPPTVELSTHTTHKCRHTTSHTPPTSSSPPDGSSTRHERGTILLKNIQRMGALSIMRCRRSRQP